jgi:hypothetical protein
MSNTTTMSAKTIRAITKYGMEACIKAYTANAMHGEGPATVACIVDGINSVAAANAAIHAGREIMRSQLQAAVYGGTATSRDIVRLVDMLRVPPSERAATILSFECINHNRRLGC